MPIYTERKSENTYVGCLLKLQTEGKDGFVAENSSICSKVYNASKSKIYTYDEKYYKQICKIMSEKGIRSIGIEFTDSDEGRYLFVRKAFLNVLWAYEFDLDVFLILEEGKNLDRVIRLNSYAEKLIRSESYPDTIKLRECQEKNLDFADALMFWVDYKGVPDSVIYEKANVSASSFNKIKNRTIVGMPEFETVLELAIGLRLSKEAATDFLSRAGYAFKPWDKRDQFILNLISKQECNNVNEFNDELFANKYETIILRRDKKAYDILNKIPKR